jgi:GMP synthase (glutamine-hydrolysing)
VVALGGSVRRNPRGRELPIARAITTTQAGRAHSLFGSRPAVFDALCSHLDEIETLPPNAQVLAANELSAIQAIAAQTAGRGSFHGTQSWTRFAARPRSATGCGPSSYLVGSELSCAPASGDAESLDNDKPGAR